MYLKYITSPFSSPQILVLLLFHLKTSYLVFFPTSRYGSPPFSSSPGTYRNPESICRWPLSFAPGASVHELSDGGAMGKKLGRWGELIHQTSPFEKSSLSEGRLPEFGDGEVRATMVSWLFYFHLFLEFQAKEIYLKAKSNIILLLQL